MKLVGGQLSQLLEITYNAIFDVKYVKNALVY